jgi:arylformamidase
MPRLRYKLSQPPIPPARGVKAATFRLLLDTAMDIIQNSGHIPSVAEVAVRSNVSRATAYRYFASRSALATAVIDTSLGPVRTFASDNPNGRERVRELFAQTFPRFKEFEPQLRAAAQLSLEQWALERAGLLQEEPYRRGHRVGILKHAIAPLSPSLRPAIRDRLHHALSVVYGIEPYMVLKDIWGLPDRDVERTALWMANALIDAALRESAASTASSSAVRNAQPTTRQSPAWFDGQYNNRARIPEHPAILNHWFDSSTTARDRHPEMVECEYGTGPRERLDVFPSKAPDAPILVYLHGGYWRALDKRDQSFVAPAFIDAGAMVVLPDYELCPLVTIEQIILQMVQALAWVYRNAAAYGGNPDHIVVCGHSAGGHLATMLLACDWPSVASDLPVDLVKSVMSISGLYDLEPLRHAPFLADDIKLTEVSARKVSPVHIAAPKGALVTVVGGDESEEFFRQAALIAQAWGSTVVDAISVPGCNHMDVVHELADAQSPVFDRSLQLLGLTRQRLRQVAPPALQVAAPSQ